MKALFLFAAMTSAVAAGAYETEWSLEFEAPCSAPTLYPDASTPTGVAVTSGTTLTLIDGKGGVRWQIEEEESFAAPATVADIDRDGSPDIVSILADGWVARYNSEGRRIWRTGFDTATGGFKHVVAADVLPEHGLEIIIGFEDGWMNCLNANGDVLWRFFGDKFRTGGIAVGDANGDGAPEIVYGTDNGHIYCLDGAGRVLWRYAELAPYGRSGPNLADLDADGSVEVLITRSNVGNATCLMALDGATGAFKWRTKDIMQSYVSVVCVDIEGDGKFETLHGDKGNFLYCDNADGSRKWQLELAGRGLFWAPAVGDIDGDGYVEIVCGMRGKDAVSGACAYVVGVDGTIDERLMIGSGANSSPAMGDIDGDGELEVVFATEGPNLIQALSWGGTGRVAWPSIRGDSAMTAATNINAGTPKKSFRNEIRSGGDSAGITIETSGPYLGDNDSLVTWNAPAGQDAFVELAVRSRDGADKTYIADVKTGSTEALVRWNLETPDAIAIDVTLHGGPTLASRTVKAKARRADWCDFDAVESVCLAAAGSGEKNGVDVSSLRQALIALRAERDGVRELGGHGATDTEIAEAASKLRRHAATLSARAEALSAYWSNGKSGNLVYWQDPNPWDTFDPMETPPAFGAGEPIQIKAYGDEFEDVAISLLNTGSTAFDVRCTFSEPELDQQRPKPEPALAGQITLRRAVPVPSALADRVYDALPKLDLSRSITLPPGEAQQLWLQIDTHGLEPGTHALTLYIGGLTQSPTIHSIPIEIDVWPVTLPGDVFEKMNWSNANFESASDQAVQDMVDHGISVIYGPPTPGIPVDSRGRLNGKIDWTRFDEVAARVPRHFFFLWGGPPTRQWPEGVNPDEESDAYFTGFKTAIDELAKHLESLGWSFDRWAFYPMDEPWNTGFSGIPQLKRFCENVKRAEPRAQIYTDPAGGTRVEYVSEFKGLIDVWQPEVNILKRDPELVKWFEENSTHFWAYEATSPGKDLLPLGYYRAYAWLAWKLGLDGAGYWVYWGQDTWWPLQGGDWPIVYETNDHVVPSRRWEADRDGVEDYRALYLLQKEIERARAAGRNGEADAAQTLIDEAVETLVGWQAVNIDEITRQTRDYEMDFDLLMTYRIRIAETIIAMRRD